MLTWNGLSFDFDILAEESELLSECRELALGHVDMMFHVFCDRGFPVKLIKAAEALGVQGKPAGMSGVQAPTLWAQGEHRKVLDYVAHDVRIALEIGQRCEAQKRFDWITQKGKRSSLNLNRGWLCVRDALRLPEPDTDWMDDPIPRRSFTRLID